MVLKSISRITYPKASKTLYLTIPSAMANDSQFPFRKGDVVSIEIIGDELRISKEKEVGENDGV